MSLTLKRLTALKTHLKIPGILTAVNGVETDQLDQQDYLLNGKHLAKGAPGCRRALRDLAGVKSPTASVQKVNRLSAAAGSEGQPLT